MLKIMLYVHAQMDGLQIIVTKVKFKIALYLIALNYSNFKGNCTVNEFKAKNFAKLPKIYIDDSVVPKFEKFNELAKKCKVNIQQSRSFSVYNN
jgi:hypothetical protein